MSAKEDEISVDMILIQGEKNEKIAVAYGHMYEKDITYAVEHSRDINNDFVRYSSLFELLRAKLVGARVTDQGSIRVFIRGGDIINSIGVTEDSGAALFVLDGAMVSNIDFLDPWDVRSITLLKDSGGAAIYGSRGRNGVVLINTK